MFRGVHLTTPVFVTADGSAGRRRRVVGNQAGQRQQESQGVQAPEGDPMDKFSHDQLQYFEQAAAGKLAAIRNPDLNDQSARERRYA